MEEGRVSFEFRYFKCNRGTGGKKGFGLECLGGYFVARKVPGISDPCSRGAQSRPSTSAFVCASAAFSRTIESSRVQYRCARSIKWSAHSVPCVFNRSLLEFPPLPFFFFFLQMASIEVSLSTTPRRKKGGSISGGLTSPAGPHRNSRDHYKELDALRIALRDKENIIQTWVKRDRWIRLRYWVGN